jgi:hypothetical protein
MNSNVPLLERLQPYIRLGLYELCSWRYGDDDLPDSDDGRAMLIALLRFGMADADAIRLAPWLTDSELRACKRKAPYMKWGDVGPLIKLTDAEHEGIKKKRLRHLTPYDISAADLKKRSADRANEKAAKRSQKYRQKLRDERKAMLTTDKRGDAVMQMLDFIQTGKDFRGPGCPPPYCYEAPVSALVEQAKKSDAFGGVSPRAVRTLVHRTVKKLKALGRVKTKLKPGKRGPVLWVSLSLKNKRNSETNKKQQNPVAAQGFTPKNPTVTLSTDVEEVTTPETQNLTPSKPDRPTLAASNVLPFVRPKKPKPYAKAEAAGNEAA